MITSGRATALLWLVALLAWPAAPGASHAHAQLASAAADVNASAFVAPPPILLNSTRDLYFGEVTQGQTITVPARSPYPSGTYAAGARFSGLRKNRRYTVYFALPANLTSGSSSIPVSFNGNSFGWTCVFTTNPAVCDAFQADFNPSAHTSAGTALILDIPNNAPGNSFVADFYLGGLLTVPTGPLVPGSYSAPMSVFIALTN